MNAYDLYGKLANEVASPVVLSGRYSFQEHDRLRAVADVIAKLEPRPSDRLLEIGCNAGSLLTPLSRLVSEAVGMDHPNLLERYRTAGVPVNVQLFPGRWPDQRPEGNFDRVVVYSVLHYLPDAESIRKFVDSCLDVLKPGGRILLGDIVNPDAKRRFVASEYGQSFVQSWRERNQSQTDDDAIAQRVFSELDIVSSLWDDRTIFDLLAHVRGRGFESYVLPQPDDLPFGHTREDILIVARR